MSNARLMTPEAAEKRATTKMHTRVRKYGESRMCNYCKKTVLVGKMDARQAQRLAVKKAKNWYCSSECGKASNLLAIQTQGKKMAKIINSPESQAKAQATRRRNGTDKPIWIRDPSRRHLMGGNGKLTEPQKMLQHRLEQELTGWSMELPVHLKPEKGYPTNYKLDIGNASLRIGIELDGQSHNNPTARRADQKKTQKLEKLGWRVLRFSNKQILNDLELCVTQIMSIVSK